MTRDSREHTPSPTTGEQRYAHVVELLLELTRRVDDLAQHVDEIDRALRPYGDGWRPKRRGAA